MAQPDHSVCHLFFLTGKKLTGLLFWIACTYWRLRWVLGKNGLNAGELSIMRRQSAKLFLGISLVYMGDILPSQ